MSNDEGTLNIDYEHEPKYEMQSDLLPTLAGISYWRKAFPKIRLLALGITFLVRLACPLLGARPFTTA